MREKTRTIHIQTHEVWVCIYLNQKGIGFHLHTREGAPVTPESVGLTARNGGMTWLTELVQLVKDNPDSYPEGFRAGYFGDM